MEPDFWRGKRVFLTGHTGFKGSWLSLLLASRGAEVHGLSLAPQRDSLYERARIAEVVARSTIADVRDLRAVREALDHSGADIVLHLAAQALVRPSYDSPVDTFATNVMGTVHVLEALRHAPHVRAAVVVTSDKCYENREWVWGYREDEPMGGHDPYSNSKGCAELVTGAYRRSYHLEAGQHVASARAGNVIGGGDYAKDRLLPDTVRAFRSGDEVRIRNPRAIRPWQHVLEPLSGYLRLAEALYGPDGETFADGWNFGPSADGERTVLDVVDRLWRGWPGARGWLLDQAPQQHEASFLKLDSSKARRLLDWQPRWTFEEAIDASIAWYRAEETGADMRGFTQAQIDTYFNAAGKAAGATQ